jgi:hypothetical protein
MAQSNSLRSAQLDQVEEFGVATDGGIWVAAGDRRAVTRIGNVFRCYDVSKRNVATTSATQVRGGNLVVLGINNMHDASIALVVDGQLVAAAEEERFSRIKHVSGLPVHAMQYCIEAGGVRASDLDVVVAAWRPWVLRVRSTLALKAFLDLRPPSVEGEARRRADGPEWKELSR